MTSKTNIFAIVAADTNWLIGNEDAIPWRLSSDLKRFKALTMGGALIMGRRTHESIGRALPGRLNVVMTRQKDYSPSPDTIVAHSLEAAFEAATAAGHKDLWVIGGAAIYEASLPHLNALYLTVVDGEHQGDVFLSSLCETGWHVAKKESHTEAELPHAFLTLHPKPEHTLLDPAQKTIPPSWQPER